MAASQEQKVDYLLKKIGYVSSKTGIAEDSSLTGTKKAPFAEPIPSPLVVPSTFLWADSTFIPSTPPGSTGTYVEVYATASAYQMTVDSTVSGNRTFIARATAGDSTSAIEGDWIDPSFGSDYVIKVFKGDPNSGGVQLSAAGSGSNDTWFFDYSSGVLNFNGTSVPSGVTSTNIYLVGYRYVGAKGLTPPAGIATFTSLYVAGVSTFVGTANFLSDLNIAGVTTLASSGGITTTGGDLYVGGDLYIADDLNFDEFTARNGNITGVLTSHSLQITGISTFSNDLDVNADIVVAGGVDATGIVTALRFETTTTGDTNSFYAGFEAGLTADTDSDDNVMIGYRAGYDLDNSDQNIGIGREVFSSASNDNSYANIALGYQALQDITTGDYNFAAGYQTLANLTGGTANIFNGAFGGDALLTGNYNTGLGYQALSSITDRHGNVAVGAFVMVNSDNSDYTTAVGYGAGYNCENDYQVHLGYYAGFNAAGYASINIGYQAGYNTNAQYGVHIGWRSGEQSANDYGSIAIGYQAGYDLEGAYNILMGWDAGYDLDGSGSYNIGLGYQVLYQDSGSREFNIALGYQALYGNSSSSDGDYNIAIGREAGQILTSGGGNLFLGNYAGDNVTTGSNNVVLKATSTDYADVDTTKSEQLWIGYEDKAWIAGVGKTTTLRYDNADRLDTTTHGIDVTGHTETDTLNVSGIATIHTLKATQSATLQHAGVTKLSTTGIGVSVANGVGFQTAYIEGPEEIWIDPHPFGVGQTSGRVRIRGDLYVDGKEFVVEQGNIELGDFVVGIASTVPTNMLLDGAGIGIGSVGIRKFITWHNATSSLKSTENWNLNAGKHYEIGGVDVLTSTTLGDNVVNSSLTNVGTLTSLDVSGITTVGGILDANGGLQANTAKVEDLTDNRVVIAGVGGELEDDANLTFNGSVLDLGVDLDVDGRTELDTTNVSETLNVVGVTTLASAGGITTTGGDFYVGGDLYVLDDIFYDEISGTNINITGIGTFAELDVNGPIDVDGLAELDDVNVSGTSTFNGTVSLPDNTSLTLGNDDDFELHHIANGNSYIKNNAAALEIRSNSTVINSKNNGVTFLKANASGLMATTGIVTATQINLNGDLDVDGHTELDGVNVAGGATFTTFPVDINTDLDVDGRTELDTTNIAETLNVVGITTLASAGGITTTGGDFYVGGDLYVLDDIVYDEVTGRNLNITGVGTFGEIDVNGPLNVSGVSTFAGAVDINSDLDVDGRTELDTTNISETLNVVGVTTLASAGGITTTGGDFYVGGDLFVLDDIFYDEVSGVNLNITGVATFASAQVSDLTSGRVVLAGTGGELEDSTNFTFNGTTLGVTGELDVTGHVETDTLRVSGLSTFVGVVTTQSTLFASELNVAGVSTFVGNGNFINDLTVGGNLNVTGDIVYDEVSGRNINISGISTFEGQTNIGAGGTVFFADVNTQRVGINSTIPGYALDVVGDINSSTDVKIGGVSILSLTASTDDVVALAIALG